MQHSHRSRASSTKATLGPVACCPALKRYNSHSSQGRFMPSETSILLNSSGEAPCTRQWHGKCKNTVQSPVRPYVRESSLEDMIINHLASEPADWALAGRECTVSSTAVLDAELPCAGCSTQTKVHPLPVLEGPAGCPLRLGCDLLKALSSVFNH